MMNSMKELDQSVKWQLKYLIMTSRLIQSSLRPIILKEMIFNHSRLKMSSMISSKIYFIGICKILNIDRKQESLEEQLQLFFSENVSNLMIQKRLLKIQQKNLTSFYQMLKNSPKSCKKKQSRRKSQEILENWLKRESSTIMEEQ